MVPAAGRVRGDGDIVDQLMELELDRELVEVYARLLQIGPSKASDVARAIRVNRTDAYRRLHRLAQEGLVAATLTRPARYEAVAPERFFDVLESRFQRRLEQVRRLRNELGPSMEALLRREPEPSPKSVFRITQGRRAVQDHVVRLVQDAREEALLINTHASEQALAHDLGALALLGDGAAAWRAVVADGRMAASLADGLPAERIRVLSTPEAIRLLIVDRQQMLQGAVVDPSSRPASAEDVALWTDAPALVASQRLLFERLWQDARPLAAAR